MANIELVIKIAEEAYQGIVNANKAHSQWGNDLLGILCAGIANGTPLPKGHGDLVDRSKIYKAIPAEEDNCTGMGMTLEEMDAYNDGIDTMYMLVKGAKLIIEADKDGDAR